MMEITAKLAIPIIVAAVIVGAAGYYILANPAGSYNIAVRLDLLNPQNTTYPYAIANYRIYINNTGSTPITNMSIGVFINNAQYHVYDVTLPPHVGSYVNGSYIYQTNGTYQFKAVADPGRVLNLQDRSSAQSGFNTTVVNPISPRIYDYIPNNGVTLTESFSAKSTGVAVALYLARGFGVQQFSRMLGMGDNTTFSILNYTSSLIVGINGAYTTYANSTAIYSGWLQAVGLNSTTMSNLFSGLKIKTQSITINGTAVLFSKVDNSTSLCYAFFGGWNLILEYYNASAPGTCAGIMLRHYNATVSNSVISLLKANPDFQRYQANFTYLNSTNIGSALIYNASNTLSATDAISNKYGFFAMSLTKFSSPQDFNSISSICNNPLTKTATASVCSFPITAVSNIVNASVALIDSVGIYQNYTLQVYSFVNKNESINAHSSAAGLMSYLAIPENHLIWNGNLPAICTLPATDNGITCSLNSEAVNQLTGANIDNISIKNNLSSQIRINSIACFIPGFERNQTIGQQLNSNKALNITTSCAGTIPGLFNDYNTYNITMNYTLSGSFKTATGILKIPNTG